MSIPTFLVTKEDLDGGLLHSPGTLLLKIGGKSAAKASFATIVGMLKVSAADILSLYRLENPFVWFLVPANDGVKAKLLNRSFGEEGSIKIDISTLEGEKVKITLHWVSPTINKKKIEDILRSFAEPGSVVEAVRLGVTDKWASWIKVKKNFEIPHYIQLRVEGDPRVYKVLVTVPGRRQQCWHCGQDQHWSNQCPSKKPIGIPVKADVSSEKGTPLSYALVVKGDNLKKKKE